MLESLLLGAGFAFAAVVQPGPLQAYLLARSAAQGWRRTLPAAFAPLLSDGPIAVVALLALRALPANAAGWLQVAGGLLLLWLAASAVRPRSSDAPAAPTAPRTLFEAALVNVLNPNPYIGWSLVLGPALLRAWTRGPEQSAALLLAFYGVMVAGLALTILVFSTVRRIRPEGRIWLERASAIVLGALGVWQLFAGIQRLMMH